MLKLYVGFNMSCLPVLLFGKVCHFRNEYLDKIFAKKVRRKSHKEKLQYSVFCFI